MLSAVVDEVLTAYLDMEGLRLVKFIWGILRHAGEDRSTFNCCDKGRRGFVLVLGDFYVLMLGYLVGGVKSMEFDGKG